jgi:hypothetical protein
VDRADRYVETDTLVKDANDVAIGAALSTKLANQFAVTFTAVTRVQIPSGTPNLFKSLRGTATSCAGTKRHNSVANF